jgi:hypothetical protein
MVCLQNVSDVARRGENEPWRNQRVVQDEERGQSPSYHMRHQTHGRYMTRNPVRKTSISIVWHLALPQLIRPSSNRIIVLALRPCHLGWRM